MRVVVALLVIAIAFGWWLLAGPDDAPDSATTVAAQDAKARRPAGELPEAGRTAPSAAVAGLETERFTEDPPERPEVLIAGRVLDAVTGDPIARAIVRVDRLGGGQMRRLSVITDDSGAFSVPADSRVSAVTVGAGHYHYERSTPVSCEAGSWKEIELARAGGLRGRVIVDGHIPTGAVSVYGVATTRGPPIRVGATVQPDGRFTLYPLPSGAARVVVGLPGTPGNGALRVRDAVVLPGELLNDGLVFDLRGIVYSYELELTDPRGIRLDSRATVSWRRSAKGEPYISSRRTETGRVRFLSTYRVIDVKAVHGANGQPTLRANRRALVPGRACIQLQPEPRPAVTVGRTR